jgi:hypothetical protein
MNPVMGVFGIIVLIICACVLADLLDAFDRVE